MREPDTRQPSPRIALCQIIVEGARERFEFVRRAGKRIEDGDDARLNTYRAVGDSLYAFLGSHADEGDTKRFRRVARDGKN